jgi:hypothetical protein
MVLFTPVRVAWDAPVRVQNLVLRLDRPIRIPHALSAMSQ